MGGFDSHAEPSRLEQFIREQGELTSFQVMEGKRGRPFAFVKFAKEEQAEAFVAKNDVITFEGRALKINFKMKRVSLT